VAGKPVLTEYDRIVEAYELEPLVIGILRVLDEKGALTVADYQRELLAARSDGSRGVNG